MAIVFACDRCNVFEPDPEDGAELPEGWEWHADIAGYSLHLCARCEAVYAELRASQTQALADFARTKVDA